MTRLEREREGVKPPYLLSDEEVEEIRGLIDGNNRPEETGQTGLKNALGPGGGDSGLGEEEFLTPQYR